ncbi:MAG: transcriptional regulator [Deferrisomatales bacterium]|nr:transcriptional regulator [Deferrisomatales bacterium]
MPSSQLIRQWTLLQELAVSYRGKTMEELARLLEVGKRTARRDLEALEAAGFPTEKVPDGRHVRYRLLRGYSPPQIPFDLAEALGLFHAALLSPLFANSAYHELLESALVKLQHAFPPSIRDYVGRSKVALSHRSPVAHSPRLLGVVRILQEQAADACRVRLTYENLKGEIAERLVDPYCLRLYQGDIYLLGHCHLRGTERVFLADRIRDVTPLDEEFRKPPGFEPEDLLDTSLGIYLGEPYTAVLRFWDEAARYVLQRPLHPDQRVLERGDGHVLLEVPVRGEREVLHGVLRFGAKAEVVGPPPLREAARQELSRMAALYHPQEEAGA